MSPTRVSKSLLLAQFSCALLAGCVPAGTGIPSHRIPTQSYAGAGARQAITPETPKLKRLKNGHYRVTRPWTVVIGGRAWHVPPGYTSNGITAPAKLKGMLGDGVDQSTTWAAVFHDWLFTQPGVTRSQADQLFYELLLAYGVPRQKAQLMHTTVSAYSLTKMIR